MQFSKITLSLLLAFPTAFASISLSDTEALNKDEVTLGCLNTYSREVKECTETEITSHSCSSECAEALTTLGKDVMLACRQAYAGQDTLLRRILDGGLTPTLCKKVVDNTDSEKEEETSEPVQDDSTTGTPEKATSETEQATSETEEATSETEESTSEPEEATSESDVEPTGAAETDSTESSPTGATSSAKETSSSDDSILGDDNAAGRAGVGMGIVIGAAIAVISIL